MTLSSSSTSSVVLACWLASGSSGVVQSPDCSHRGAISIGGLDAMIVVVDASYTLAWFLLNIVVYPASANFETLNNGLCSPGIMFISSAPSRSLCFSIIFFVAFCVVPLGNINVLFDAWPVSINAPSSSSPAAPDVAPESSIPRCA